MIVVVEIDLARDERLMELCKTDPAITAMLKVHNSLDEGVESDTYLERIGRHLWQESSFPSVMVEYCSELLRDFHQPQALLFTFQTTHDCACLFRMACHAPIAVRIL